MSDNDTIVARPRLRDVAALASCASPASKPVKLPKPCWVNCLSRATPIIFRLKTPTAACSIRGLRYGSRPELVHRRRCAGTAGSWRSGDPRPAVKTHSDHSRPADCSPGEFSERAFLNDKLDLARAEAIADLIDASSEQAARSALNSLQGAFSARVNHLVEALTHLRIYVEAAIDFPDEEIDFLSDGKIEAQLNDVIADLDAVRAEARQGSLLREGMKVVIAGRPNAGKSSLLNALAGREAAIVTDIAGTTRDVLREHIHIDGMPLHIIDTAGLREASDEVERIGIERAWQEIEQADRVLFMVDGTTTDAVDPAEIWPEFIARLPAKLPITVVRNKADITGETLGMSEVNGHALIRLSARTGEGVEVLRNHLKQSMGFDTNMEGGFGASSPPTGAGTGSGAFAAR